MSRGSSPASRMAFRLASAAKFRTVVPELRANAVQPMPTMAVEPLKARRALIAGGAYKALQSAPRALGVMGMYVDHAATTPLRAEVLEAMLPYLRQEWGNPSSLHAPGRRAAQAVRRARQTVADHLNCAPEEIVFTASGSEGANLASKGAAMAARARRQIVTSRIEHHGTLDTCRWLASQLGFEVTEIDVDQYGTLDLEQLERAVTPNTAIVSV